MRHSLLLLPLATLAAPAVAAPPPQTQQIQIPPELTNPATAEKLANMMQSLSRAFFELPIGEVQAAAEGRKPTAEERRLTVRDIGRRDDPNFERNFDRQIAQAKPMIEQSMNALARALPAMTRSLSDMARQMERATANMPRPDYPRR